MRARPGRKPLTVSLMSISWGTGGGCSRARRMTTRQVSRWASGFGATEDRLDRYRRRRDRREDRELREGRREPLAASVLRLLRFLVAAALSVGVFLGGAFLILQTEWTWGWPVLLILVALIMITLGGVRRSEEHTSELQSRGHLVCRLLLE